MKEEWIPLAKICQNRGLVGLSSYVFTGLTEAFRLPVDPLDSPAIDLAFFRARCLGYVNDERVRKILNSPKLEKIMVFRPVWHYLTVEEIEVDMYSWPNLKARINPDQKPSVEWRWKYWYPAFSWFWAFLFHTENEFLCRPEIIWQEINRHTNEFVNLERKPDENSQAIIQFYLAFYERVLALRHDILTEKPHYIKNIVGREGLNPEDSRDRPQLFEEAVNFLWEMIEKELTAYLG